ERTKIHSGGRPEPLRSRPPISSFPNSDGLTVMPGAVRFGDNSGRVDKSGLAETWKRTRRLEDGEGVEVEPPPCSRQPTRRPSRSVDPKRVRSGFLIAFIHLLDSGDYTPEEIARVFRISRATVYRHIRDIRSLRLIDRELRQAGQDEYDEY